MFCIQYVTPTAYFHPESLHPVITFPILTLSRMRTHKAEMHVNSGRLGPTVSRRHSRVEARGGVYVYWRSAGHERIAPVRNLSMGGLFIETDTPPVPGITAKLHFLVQEGQIRADAVVRHAEPGRGLGLRFTAVRNDDRLRLAELMKRLRGLNG